MHTHTVVERQTLGKNCGGGSAAHCGREKYANTHKQYVKNRGGSSAATTPTVQAQGPQSIPCTHTEMPHFWLEQELHG